MTVNVLRGISTSMFLRLCWRAPCTLMRVSMEELYLPESGRSSIVADGAGAGRVLPVAVRASSNLACTQSRSRLIRGE